MTSVTPQDIDFCTKTTVANIKTVGDLAAEVNRNNNLVGRIVPITLATTLSPALHEGRIVGINTTSALIVTLPAATGSGARYEIVNLATAPAGGHQIRTNTGDFYNGIAIIAGGTLFTGAANGTTQNNISFNGTTTGGIIGTRVLLTDARAGFFTVQVFAVGSGAGATCFGAV